MFFQYDPSDGRVVSYSDTSNTVDTLSEIELTLGEGEDEALALNWAAYIIDGALEFVEPADVAKQRRKDTFQLILDASLTVDVNDLAQFVIDYI